MTVRERIVSPTIQQYLNEMGQTPLLSRKEERVLAEGLEADRAELRRLVLSSPIALRQLLNWSELVESGEGVVSIEGVAAALLDAAGAVEDVDRRVRGSAVDWSRDWDAAFSERLLAAIEQHAFEGSAGVVADASASRLS